MTQVHQRASINGLGPDRAEAVRFLDLIAPCVMNFSFQTFDDDKARREGRAEANKLRKKEDQLKDPFAKVLHGTLDQHFDELVRLNGEGAGVFVTINETDLRGRSKENIVRVRCLFLDLDGSPLPTEGPRPHIVVETSDRRWHCYWKVDDVKLDDFRAKQKGLIARYGGDQSVHDLPRVMRLPGFFHRKGAPCLVRTIQASDLHDLPEYHAADFPSAAEEPHQPSGGDPTADPARVIAALAVIPNDHEPLKGYAVPSKGEPRRNDDWDTWCNLGFAIFRAVGDEVGQPLFDAWSRKSPKHSDAGTLQKWKDIKDYPPNEITAASIFYRANLENPRWPALIGNSIEAAIEIVGLAALSPAAYDQQRKDAAKRLGMRVGTLDDLVERLRSRSGGDADDDKQGQEISFKPPEPWPDPVDGAALVNDLIGAHRKYVIMSEHGALAVALWEIHAYALDAAEHSPRLQIKSPTYRCGKTTLMKLIKAIVPKPIETTNISMAALFRLIEMCQPTVLLDEAETSLKRENGKDNEDMRMIFNAGHRRGDGVVRTVGDDFEPRFFGVFGPLCFCWLVRRGEQVAQTIADRSITIELRRRLKNETITRLRSNRIGNLSVLGRRAARWVADNMQVLTDADPVMSDDLNDRAQDNWRPLIAIADAISKDLGDRARAAALAIDAEAATADDDTSLLALADADDIFCSREAKWLSSEALTAGLVDLGDRPWSTWRKGSGNGREPITKHGVARLLKPFGLKPRLIRTPGNNVFRGYEAKSVRDAKMRFVDTETGLGDEVVDVGS